MAEVFKSVKLFPDYANGFFIQWELDELFKDTAPYIFTYQVAETIDFQEPYYEITTTDQFYVFDRTNNRRNALSDDYIYRIKLETHSGNTYYSRPRHFNRGAENPRYYAMAAEIIRKENLYLAKAGIACWLLKRKNFGVSDKAVIDEVSGLPIAHQSGDYGTGFNGGYYKPLPIHMAYMRGSYDARMSDQGFGVVNPATSQVRMAPYPLADFRDIIVTASTNTRYNIATVSHTYFPSTFISVTQTGEIKEIPPTDTLYELEVPFDYPTDIINYLAKDQSTII